MSEQHAITIIHRIQLICFVLAQLNNSVLLLLIWRKADEKFGSYRYVMAMFSCYSLVYSWIEMAILPVLFIKLPVFAIIIDGCLKNFVAQGPLAVAVYCGSFALCIALLAAQFVYRYLVVCKPEYFRFISGYKCINLILPCIASFIIWGCLTLMGFVRTPEVQQFLREDVLQTFSIDLNTTGFSAMTYWFPDGKGGRIWNSTALLEIFGMDLIIGTCVSIILYCGYAIYRDIQSKRSLMSELKIALHWQLFISLTLQTILPFVLMYMTIGFIISSPLLSIEIGKFASMAGVNAAFYPALEPCVAMICIKDFRETLMIWRKRRVNPQSASNTRQASAAVAAAAP